MTTVFRGLNAPLWHIWSSGLRIFRAAESSQCSELSKVLFVSAWRAIESFNKFLPLCIARCHWAKFILHPWIISLESSRCTPSHFIPWQDIEISGDTSTYLDTKIHPQNEISGSGIRAVCRTVIRNYLGPWIVARVRFWECARRSVSLVPLLPFLSIFSRSVGVVARLEGGGGSMVRSARILRVTRVAARLDCLQRLSNRRSGPGKTNCFHQATRDKPILRYANAGWREGDREFRRNRGELARLI